MNAIQAYLAPRLYGYVRKLHSIIMLSATVVASTAFWNGPLDAQGTHTLVTGNRKDLKRSKMKLNIGSTSFTVKLCDNATVTKLKAMLPMTLEMSELNGNEKYYHLPTELPTDETTPGTIRSGDLMLWEKNSLVLFYKTFKSSYSYTRLGQINAPSKLASVVGKGGVTITFDIE